MRPEPSRYFETATQEEVETFLREEEERDAEDYPFYWENLCEFTEQDWEEIHQIDFLYTDSSDAVEAAAYRRLYELTGNEDYQRKARGIDLGRWVESLPQSPELSQWFSNNPRVMGWDDKSLNELEEILQRLDPDEPS